MNPFERNMVAAALTIATAIIRLEYNNIEHARETTQKTFEYFQRVNK